MSDTKQLSHYIDGQWVAGAAASDSLNPSDTRDIVAKVPGGDKSTVNAAVSAAKAAFPAWANASPEVRSDLLDKVGSLIMARADDLGRLLSREEGKTVPEGIGETVRAARILKYFAGEALRAHGQNLASTRPGVEVQTYRQAVGVFGLITPWNFPIAIPAWKGMAAGEFERVRTQYAKDLRDLNRALLDTSESIRASGAGYSASDSAAASRVTKSAGAFKLPL